MPAAEIETTHTTSPVEKDVEKFPEKNETNCKDDKACEEASTEEENVKTTEESRKMKEENFPEKENIIKASNMVSKDAETAEFEDEKSANDTEDETTKMAENSKRKSMELRDATNQTKEEHSPPKKRKST